MAQLKALGPLGCAQAAFDDIWQGIWFDSARKGSGEPGPALHPDPPPALKHLSVGTRARLPASDLARSPAYPTAELDTIRRCSSRIERTW
jgi:hypothetical protein